MIIVILGIIDIIAGIVLTFSGLDVFHGNGIVFFLAIAMILKGAWSWLNNLMSGFKLDFMGVLDIVVGILMLLTFGGFFLFFFAYFGIMEVIKGVYSFVVGLVR